MAPMSTVERHEVLVLGGGVAGLAAATALVAGGIDVAVVEARPRFGGRIWTRRDSSRQPVELGAEFVHGDAPRTRAVARGGHLEFDEVRSAQRWALGGMLLEAPDLDRSLHDAVGAATRAAERGSDRSFVDALAAAGVDERGRALAIEYVQSLQAADADRISARALATGDVGDEHTRRVTGGYDRVVHALLRRLPPASLAPSCVVQAVRWRRELVEVLTGTTLHDPPDRTFTAERAIVALPLGVLPEVQFAPALASFESKARALRGLAYGHATRVALRFREAVWSPELPPPTFLHVPGGAWPAFWSVPSQDSPLLVAWAGGPAARALEAAGLSASGLADRALQALSEALAIPRAALDEAVDGTWTHDWSRDPFSRGAYSYPVVGGAGAAEALATPLDGTLFFAGEATSAPPANGTVEGALESGHRAAAEALRAIGLKPRS
jgi:monoamine oxidase